MKVYWAFFWENEDRDDSGKPLLAGIDPEDEN